MGRQNTCYSYLGSMLGLCYSLPTPTCLWQPGDGVKCAVENYCQCEPEGNEEEKPSLSTVTSGQLCANLKKARYEAHTPSQVQMVPVGFTVGTFVSELYCAGSDVFFSHTVVLFSTFPANTVGAYLGQLNTALLGSMSKLLTGTVYHDNYFLFFKKEWAFNIILADIIMTLVFSLQADTMLKMGFQQQVLEVLEHVPEEQQTLLTSATIPKGTEVGRLTQDLVCIAIVDKNQACANIRQIGRNVFVTEMAIFCITPLTCVFLVFAQDGKLYQPPVVGIIDCKPGADLLCEPGSRGLKLVNVKLVVFDMSPNMDKYVHQLGRAGRLGHRGTVKPTGSQLPPPAPQLPSPPRARMMSLVTKTNLLDIIRKHNRLKR
uniref:DEAD (Asp-Glu-Ala-Asp) box polypeptide 59 n=1 Tax=Salmo trutta TaxID=8032 RepID=A0A673ZKI3_SALTR